MDKAGRSVMSETDRPISQAYGIMQRLHNMYDHAFQSCIIEKT